MNEEKINESCKEMLCEEINKIVKKGDVTPAELERLEKAYCLIEKIDKIDGAEMSDYGTMRSSGYHGMNRHYYDSYSGTPMRNGTHMDSYERGYSGHSINDRMIASLENMYGEAQTDHERQVVDKWIKKIRADM